MDRTTINSPKIRDRQSLLRWSRKEQVTHRHVNGIGEGLQLLDRRLHITGFPQGKLGEAVIQVLGAFPSTLARPGQKLRMDSCPRHANLVVRH
jgi:hypothetical protein